MINNHEFRNKPSVQDVSTALNEAPRVLPDDYTPPWYTFQGRGCKLVWDNSGIIGIGECEQPLDFIYFVLACEECDSNPRCGLPGSLSVLGLPRESNEPFREYTDRIIQRYSSSVLSKNKADDEAKLREGWRTGRSLADRERHGYLSIDRTHPTRLDADEFDYGVICFHFSNAQSPDGNRDALEKGGDPIEAKFHPICILLPWRWIPVFTSTLSISGRAVRMKTGLFSRRSVTVPARRIEKLDIGRPLLGRLLGYGSITVSTGSHVFVFRHVRNISKLEQRFGDGADNSEK